MGDLRLLQVDVLDSHGMRVVSPKQWVGGICCLVLCREGRWTDIVVGRIVCINGMWIYYLMLTYYDIFKLITFHHIKLIIYKISNYF